MFVHGGFSATVSNLGEGAHKYRGKSLFVGMGIPHSLTPLEELHFIIFHNTVWLYNTCVCFTGCKIQWGHIRVQHGDSRVGCVA